LSPTARARPPELSAPGWPFDQVVKGWNPARAPDRAAFRRATIPHDPARPPYISGPEAEGSTVRHVRIASRCEQINRYVLTVKVPERAGW